MDAQINTLNGKPRKSIQDNQSEEELAETNNIEQEWKC